MPKLLLMCTSALLVSACGNNAPISVPVKIEAASPYKPSATIQEIMDSIVDPSSDFIWQSVSTLSDATGVHEHQPRTDAEWHEFRRRAILLAEAANLLAVPGRRVANGNKTVEDGEALDVAQIQQRLDAEREQMLGFASALREISLALVAVADKKDVPAVTTLGGTLDEVCESCHKVFWYPDPLPIITTKQ